LTVQLLGLTSDTDLLSLANDALTVNGTVTVGTLAAGAGNSVVTQNSGTLEARTIDSRVWGSTLVDGTGSSNQVAYWSDSNTIAGENQLICFSRGGTGVDGSQLATDGQLLIGT
jgi:hypothetical protein